MRRSPTSWQARRSRPEARLPRCRWRSSAGAPIDAPRPPADAARARVWGEAFGLLVFVGGLGVAEVELLSVPSWLGLVFVALGCAMAVDRLRLGRRAGSG